MKIESPEINLNPGIVYDGKEIKTAKVRLLQRGERKAIDLLPEDKQDDKAFIDSIVSLGQITDRAKIGEAVEFLYAPDEARINIAIKELHEKYSDPPKSESESAAKS